MISYLLRHAQVLLSSMGHLARSPGSTLMTVCAIGITLALPTLLYLVVQNVEEASRNLQGKAQVSVFLKLDLPTEAAEALRDELSRLDAVASSQLITAEQALDEFRSNSGFGEALDILSDNPLPSSIILHIEDSYDDPAVIEPLVNEISTRPEVDLAQWDMAWVMRLHVILELIQRAVIILAVLLVLAVVIIISNTIRLAILNRRDEIEIMKLIGATNRFIRRPFLYDGVLQGLLGALCAVAIVSVCIKLLQDPVVELITLYRSDFATTGISLRAFAALLAAGSALGWLSARAAVGRYLRHIEPK